MFNEWLQTEAELTRERALWGPPVGSRLDKWSLDMTEGKNYNQAFKIKHTMCYNFHVKLLTLVRLISYKLKILFALAKSFF